MTGYSIPFTLDRTSHWGGILLFVRKDIPCKIIKTEINLRKKKWLLCCSYNPQKNNIANHLKNICKTLDNIALLGDFNVELEEESIAEF